MESEAIEEKWRRAWEVEKTFEAEPDPSKKKIFVTMPFPYMNGPLHIGHGFTAVRLDVYARFKRMQGYNVLFPWAWHWTGQPIFAAAERLSKNDPVMIREFVEIDRIPRDLLPRFYDPTYMANYYTESGREALKRLGLSIDWRRDFHTSDLEPTFNKFVLWQYDKLREMGYVTRGTHPVVWCPHDQSPTGDHDRLEGEGVAWEEFTLVLFTLSDSGARVFLPAATLRPETIFAVTNLWINPEAEYVEITYPTGERWIVSKEAAEKLLDQLKKFEVTRKFLGKDLVGRKVLHPLQEGTSLLILPGEFVSPKNGSGIVYSVPAHAPADYIALRDLKTHPALVSRFNLDPDEIESIEPIDLIRVPDMGKFPAVETVEKMKIEDQMDPRLSKATEEVYKREFHKGVLNDRSGAYSGMPVADAKPLIISDLKSKGLADAFYELPSPVICRCTTPCTVKVLEDQWFLKYSDAEWKKQSHECVNKGDQFPPTIKQWLHDTIDWLRDWPCARRVGLGTPLAWAPGWIVETLSDSTIYMSFYTIRNTLVRLGVSAEQLGGEFFDFVFLGKGKSDLVGSKTGIDARELEKMRSEFLYWYPVDLRNSAKELIPNHLTFFVFQHVAFYPQQLWPRGISANGVVAFDGVKMSKSKGNVVTITTTLNEYGADATRAALVSGAEGLDDLEWSSAAVKDLVIKIRSISDFIVELNPKRSSNRQVGSYSQIDLWLEDQIQSHISKISAALDDMKTKTAFQEAFYAYWNTLRRYLNRSRGEHNPSVREYAVDVWVRLLSPFIPFASEEIYSRLGSKKLVSTSPFPQTERSRLHPEARLAEVLLERLEADVQNVLKILPQGAKKLYVYVSPIWKYDLLKLIYENRKAGERKPSAVLQSFFASHDSIPKKEAADSLPKISETINDFGEQFFTALEETGWSTADKEAAIYSGSADHLKRKLNLEIFVSRADEKAIYDPKSRARNALPFKPALFLE
jgi:leucyl-tRNA synthetase